MSHDFKTALDAEAMAFFNKVSAQPFSMQAVAFLNAYWEEVGDQAEFIYSVSWEWFKKVEMESQGISLIHLYDEGQDLDFDMGLYFYEQIVKFVQQTEKKWSASEWQNSQPTMMTALKRKKELRDKVDVNFDGRVGFLEYLLYQYQEFANPADFTTRSMKGGDEHPEVRKARLALEACEKAIKAYETEKYRLEQLSAGTGVKALKAKNMLAQLGASPLFEALNVSLIKAGAALRKVVKMFGPAGASGDAGEGHTATDGAIWWMQRDLRAKKERYGR